MFTNHADSLHLLCTYVAVGSIMYKAVGSINRTLFVQYATHHCLLSLIISKLSPLYPMEKTTFYLHKPDSFSANKLAHQLFFSKVLRILKAQNWPQGKATYILSSPPENCYSTSHKTYGRNFDKDKIVCFSRSTYTNKISMEIEGCQHNGSYSWYVRYISLYCIICKAHNTTLYTSSTCYHVSHW